MQINYNYSVNYPARGIISGILLYDLSQPEPELIKSWNHVRHKTSTLYPYMKNSRDKSDVCYGIAWGCSTQWTKPDKYWSCSMFAQNFICLNFLAIPRSLFAMNGHMSFTYSQVVYSTYEYGFLQYTTRKTKVSDNVVHRVWRTLKICEYIYNHLHSNKGL